MIINKISNVKFFASAGVHRAQATTEKIRIFEIFEILAGSVSNLRSRRLEVYIRDLCIL